MGGDYKLPTVLLKRGFSLDTHIFRYKFDDFTVDKDGRYSEGYSYSELTGGNIWHSSVRGLNDPFELYFSPEKNDNPIENYEFYDIFRDEYLRRNALEPEWMVKKAFENVKEDFKKNVIKSVHNGKILDNYLKEVRERLAMACFSERCDSRLMWGYYCKGLKGMCFVYNRQKLIESGLNLRRVEYLDGKPEVNLVRHAYDYKFKKEMGALTAVTTHKHMEWKHECEYRSLMRINNEEGVIRNGFIYKLRHNCVDGVILGKMCGEELKTRVRKFARRNHIKVFMAGADLENYVVSIYQ